MIRFGTEDDIHSVDRIYTCIHDREEKGSVEIGWLRDVYPVRQTAIDALNRGDLFVEEIDGKIVASAIINQQQVPEYAGCDWKYAAPADEIMVLHTLTVDPSIESKGYGRAFVEFYENYAREHGCHFLRLDTQSKNAAARRFYKKLGYSEAGTVRCNFNGIPNVELICLEKRLL